MAGKLTIKKNAARKLESIEITQEVIAKLQEMGYDPLVEMARYAIGDVVGLGLMTQEELDREEEYDCEGIVVGKSGRKMAMELIPPGLRAQMAKELAQYIHRKLKPSELDVGGGIQAQGMVFYMPSNGREKDVPFQPQAQITDERDRDDA